MCWVSEWIKQQDGRPKTSVEGETKQKGGSWIPSKGGKDNEIREITHRFGLNNSYKVTLKSYVLGIQAEGNQDNARMQKLKNVIQSGSSFPLHDPSLVSLNHWTVIVGNSIWRDSSFILTR